MLSFIKWVVISIVVAFIGYVSYKLGVKHGVAGKVKKVWAAGYAKFKTFIN